MTKTAKAFPSILVSVIAVSILTYGKLGTKVADAAAPHGWEYTNVTRNKAVQGTVLGGNAIIGDWTTWIGAKQVNTEDPALDVANRLGAQGWELVTVYPVAGNSGGPLTASGMTTDLVWLFKRPRQ